MEKDEQLQRPLLRRDCDHGLDRSEAEYERVLSQPPSSIHLWSWLAQLLLFGASLTVFFLASPSPRSCSSPQGRCVEKLSAPSPALEVVSDEYAWRRFDGKVKDNPSPYKGRPTPQVLAEWENITDERYIRIDHATLLQIGSPESSVRPADGRGYAAGLDVFHQLHCVSELWKNTWPELYRLPEAGDEHSVYRQHLDHCADMLRQKLMCDADVTLVPLNWVKHLSHPTPNFNSLHKCRSFDDVLTWAEERRIQLPNQKPADAIELEDFP